MGVDFGDTQGLLSGLASGLQSGMEAYDKEDDRRRRIAEMQMKIDAQKLKTKEDESNRVRSTNLSLATKGFMQDPLNPVGFVQDPNSPVTQHASEEFDLKKKTVEQKAIENRIAQSDKSSKESGMFYKDLISKADSARGNQQVSQAEKDLQNSQKAKSLINMVGDPDNMSPQMFKLLTAETAKVASGGQTNMHELQGMDPGSFKGELAATWQKVVNHPTPAHMGAFVKQYADYNNVIGRDAENLLTDRFGRLGASYKSHISPQDYDTYDKTYIHRFSPPAGGSAGLLPSSAAASAAKPDWAK